MPLWCICFTGVQCGDGKHSDSLQRKNMMQQAVQHKADTEQIISEADLQHHLCMWDCSR